EPCQVTTEIGEFFSLSQCAQFMQQSVAAFYGRRRRWVNERKIFNLAQSECFHAQNYLGQIRALDFRLSEQWAIVEIGLRIEPNAHTVLHSATATLALVGTALSDWFDGQSPGSGPWIVPADTS